MAASGCPSDVAPEDGALHTPRPSRERGAFLPRRGGRAGRRTRRNGSKALGLAGFGLAGPVPANGALAQGPPGRSFPPHSPFARLASLHLQKKLVGACVCVCVCVLGVCVSFCVCVCVLKPLAQTVGAGLRTLSLSFRFRCLFWRLLTWPEALLQRR